MYRPMNPFCIEIKSMVIICSFGFAFLRLLSSWLWGDQRSMLKTLKWIAWTSQEGGILELHLPSANSRSISPCISFVFKCIPLFISHSIYVMLILYRQMHHLFLNARLRDTPSGKVLCPLSPFSLQTRGFGSRRHYTFSSPTYWAASRPGCQEVLVLCSRMKPSSLYTPSELPLEPFGPLIKQNL